jgi:hypothetical protein
MGTVAEDRAYADMFMPQLSRVVDGVLTRPASFRLDVSENTDLIVFRITGGPRKGQPVGAIACRVRRPGFYYGRTYRSPTAWGVQFTIRTRRSSGAETELAKVRRGFGDWMIYGHIEGRLLRHWMVLDLEIFRANEARPRVIREEIDNRDGTFFSAYDVRTFPDAILVATSDTMRLALERGVEAVEPLPYEAPRRKLIPPPPLPVELYGKPLTEDVQRQWAEFDRAMARWKGPRSQWRS